MKRSLDAGDELFELLHGAFWDLTSEVAFNNRMRASIAERGSGGREKAKKVYRDSALKILELEGDLESLKSYYHKKVYCFTPGEKRITETIVDGVELLVRAARAYVFVEETLDMYVKDGCQLDESFSEKHQQARRNEFVGYNSVSLTSVEEMKGVYVHARRGRFSSWPVRLSLSFFVFYKCLKTKLKIFYARKKIQGVCGSL